MSGDTEVIRQFLVALGFKIDEPSLGKFTKTLGLTNNLAVTAAKSVIGVAVAVEAAVVATASNLEKLYYASRRTDSTVTSIQSLEYAFKRVGVAGGAALDALEAMTAAARMNPGLRGLIDSLLGKNTEGLDQAQVMLDLVQKLSQMPHIVGAQYAGLFGIDEKTFLMLKQGLPELLEAEKKRREMGREAGVDMEKAADASKEMMNSIRDIVEKMKLFSAKFTTEMLGPFRELNGELNRIADKMLKLDIGQGIKDFITFYKTYMSGYQRSSEKVLDGDLSGAAGAMIKYAPGTALIRKLFGMKDDDGGARTSGGKVATAPSASSTATVPGNVTNATLPLGLRQNNPGNLRSWGNNAVRNGFAQFDNVQSGLSAMAGNLLAYYDKHGLRDIRGIIKRYAPPKDNNDTSGYIAQISKQLGVSDTQALNLKDPAVLSRLMGAMIQKEQGYNPFGTGELMAAANSRLNNAGKSVTLNQKTEIHVHGGGSGTANEVLRNQGRVNTDAARNLQGAIN